MPELKSWIVQFTHRVKKGEETITMDAYGEHEAAILAWNTLKLTDQVFCYDQGQREAFLMTREEIQAEWLKNHKPTQCPAQPSLQNHTIPVRMMTCGLSFISARYTETCRRVARKRGQ